MARTKLKAPFPAFGGKARIAELVWDRLGNPDNFIEPFFNSGAVTLLRPSPPKIETVNDADHYIANFWRATQRDPEAVVEYADQPVNEATLHASHRWLVLSDDAKAFREKMRTDPDYFDPKVAGRWVWGICAWIGSGWCSVSHCESEQIPSIGTGGNGDGTRGVHKSSGNVPGLDARKPRIDGGEGQYGHGVHAKGELPPLSCGTGIHAGAGGEGLSQKMPKDRGRGMDAAADGHRPQLADAYSRGRGVHNDSHLSQKIPLIGDPPRGVHSGTAGTCEERRLWLLDWFGRLRDRLRTVRVCCGDFLRVCDSESVTTRLGLTGIFFDAPYRVRLRCGKSNRNGKLYATDGAGTDDVVDRVIAYCVERGGNPLMRIAACSYEGEGYEVLLDHGWECVAWQSSGGYGNRSAVGKANAKRERIFFSPNCIKEPSLFDAAE